MCILFVFVDNCPSDDGYQIILASNRDEFYDRLTKPAAFWEGHPDCISGLDLEAGDGHGTWLGLSTKGKICTVLNITLQWPPDKTKKSRGNLVSDYLLSDITADEYIKTLAEKKHDYNGFNLLCLEKTDGWKITYFTNAYDNSPCILEPGVHGISNHVYMNPFQKVVDGKAVFADLLRQYNSKQKSATLKDELISLMSNNSPHLPDPLLENSYRSSDFARQSSAIYHKPVNHNRYGTRTNTVILVDKQGTVEYLERTMREPIDAISPQWDTREYHCILNSDTASPL